MVSSRVGGFIAFISGLVAAFSIFLVWFAVRIDFGIGAYSSDISGWNVFQDADLDYHIIPIIVAILGIVVLIFSIVGLAGMKNIAPAKVMGALTLLLGVACVALTLFYYYESVVPFATVGGIFDNSQAMEFSPMGSGVIAAIVAGALMVVSGLMGLFVNSSD